MNTSKFRSWLRSKIDELDFLQEFQPDPQVREEAGIIAREAGNRAAGLGLTALYQLSRNLRDSITAQEAKAYLSECLARLEDLTPPEAQPEGGMIGIDRAARLLGLSVSGVRKLVDRSRKTAKGESVRGPVIRFHQARPGGPILFRPEWIDDYVDGHTVDTPPTHTPPTSRTRKSHGSNWGLG